MQLPKLGLNRHYGFLLALSNHSLWGDQLPCQDDTQAALWSSPHDEDLRPPANSQVSVPSWKWALQLQSSLRMSAAQACLDTS